MNQEQTQYLTVFLESLWTMAPTILAALCIVALLIVVLFFIVDRF